MTVRSQIDIGFPYTHSTGPVVGRALAALRDGVILGARCTSCMITVVPAREWCDRCGSSLDRTVAVGPGGTIALAAHVHVATPIAPSSEPFAWALIRLDGADTDLLHIASPDARTGDRVHAVWRADRGGSITDIERFAPGDPPERPGVPEAEHEGTIEIFERNVSLPFDLSAGRAHSRFYEDIRARRRINGVRCTSCRMVLVPPREVCPRCWAPTDDWIEVADSGVIETFAVVNVPFHGQEMPLPYVLAHIRLDGADTTMLHVVGDVEASEVHTGMRVEAVWRDERTGFLNDDVRWFRPIGSAR